MLAQFNGKVICDKSAEQHNEILHVDACLKGMGGRLGKVVCACPIPSYIVLDEKLFIVHLEMLNLLIALQLWADRLRGKRVTIYCDNAVVSVISTDKSRDLFLAALTHNIWLITAMWDIELNIKPIPSKDNTEADVLNF